MFIGVLLLLVGVLLLLQRFGIICGDFWDWFWPIVVIAIGLSMIFKNLKRP